MTESPQYPDRLSPSRRRRVIQIVFIFINLALVEVHLPGPLWLAIGALFWIALLALTISGSSLVCGTMCWIGAIQDIFEPFARSRIRLDPRLGRAATFAVLALWMPIGWLVVPELASHDRTPLDMSLGWERHAFQFGLGALTALSVVVLGKRGICRYLCPFNSIVATLRRFVTRFVPRRPRAATTLDIVSPTCPTACSGCARHAQTPIPEGSFS
jgi:polyferredoxin